MKIAIISAGRLPVPATRGGAVETKLDYIMAYNAEHHLHDITMYSISPDNKPGLPTDTAENHYRHIDNRSLAFRIGQRIYQHLNRRPFYDSYIEYFLYLCLRHVRRQHYDVIITTNRPGYTEKIVRATRTPLILQLNNDYLNPGQQYAARTKQRCAGVITCSHYINRLASAVPCDKQVPVITVHNGIDIGRFVHAQPIPRAQLNMDSEDFVVVFSGRIIPEKGVLELIQAIKGIQDIPRLKLLIIGASFYGADTHVSPYMSKLMEAAAAIREQVIFTGYVDYCDMPAYLKMGNIAVIPSVWDEPFGLTVLEAMAAGLPLVTTQGGGIPEICENTAILVERDDIVPRLTEAIRHLYHQPEMAAELGRKAQKRSWLFDKDIFSKTYLNAVEHIVKEL